MTDTYLSKLRQAARKLKRSSGIGHYAALDVIANTEGHPSWSALVASIAARAAVDVDVSRPEVPPAKSLVQHLAIRKSSTYIFHHVQIEEMRFAGLAAPLGPFVNSMNERGDIVDQVALGVCSIATLGTQWWVCKYGDQPHINITPLSQAGRRALAREFGIDRGIRRGDAFFDSPAFQSLVAWAKANPRRARRAGEHSPYIFGWYERATGKTIPRPPLDPDIKRRIDALFAHRDDSSDDA